MTNWFPVIQVDPNGPWREIDGVLCLVASVTDKDLADDLRSGEIERGEMIIEFQPNEPEGGGKNEYGWGNLAKLVDWTDLSNADRPDYIHVYLARPFPAVTISE